MIFITVGSRSFQFDRLLKAVDEAVGKGLITDEIFAQIGSSTYNVKNFATKDFLNHDEFNRKMNECDIVLTHGGTGVIVNALKSEKRVVAIPRLPEYSEVIDNHQIEIVQAFEKKGLVTACYDCNQIAESINIAKGKETIKYVSNTDVYIDSIDKYINNNLVKTKRRIRVLMCGSHRREKGGMNSVIEQLLNNDWGNDYKMMYLATHISGSSIKKILFFLKAYLKLIFMTIFRRFDVIHIHMSYKGSFHRKYYVAKTCRFFRIKTIIHLHGSEFKEFYNNADDSLKSKIKRLFNDCDKTIVLGDAWNEFIKSICPKANTYVLHNSVKLPKDVSVSNNETKNILFMGALIKRKGVSDLLEAVKMIKERGYENFVLLIGGTGEEEKNLHDYVNENNLSENVKFLGWIENNIKEEIYSNADIFILPSYNEGLPIAILEALSYGLPVISTNVGSIDEAVKNDINGFLLRPGDINEMADKIIALIDNPILLNKQSVNARTIAEDKFSDDKYYDKIKGIYFDLMKTSN